MTNNSSSNSSTTVAETTPPTPSIANNGNGNGNNTNSIERATAANVAEELSTNNRNATAAAASDDNEVNARGTTTPEPQPVSAAVGLLAAEKRMGQIKAEYKKIDDIGWQRKYMEIRETSEREANEKNYVTSESEKPENRCYNRYRDVNPYDHSRIIIHRGNVNYINANLVKFERADRQYILTQGPLNDTVGHFWLMIWEQRSKAILMLNKLVEKRQVKCHMYWPDKLGPENAMKLPEVALRVELLRCERYENYCQRWFKLEDLNSNEHREIIQFHYTTWPDFGIPSSPVAFLQFLQHVRESGALEPNVGPAVVHCSAGIGRSGTFCLVDCSLVLIDKEGESNVSVQDVLYELRRYRMGLIQTADQLYFSYKAILEGMKLLKDPEFLNTKEVPIEGPEESSNLEETPPPLPPRTHSLQVAGNNEGPTANSNKGRYDRERMTTDEILALFDHGYKGGKGASGDGGNSTSGVGGETITDEMNNFINTERSNAAAAGDMTNRPLPPLPMHENPLDQLVESDSDGNELYENDDEDDEDADAENGHDPSDDRKEVVTKKQEETNANELIGNGIEGGVVPSVSAGNSSPNSELTRRRREQRATQLLDKVNEIKRKAREAEKSPPWFKRPRSIVTYIAIGGVVMGVIYAYAYTKSN